MNIISNCTTSYYYYRIQFLSADNVLFHLISSYLPHNINESRYQDANYACLSKSIFSSGYYDSNLSRRSTTWVVGEATLIVWLHMPGSMGTNFIDTHDAIRTVNIPWLYNYFL